MFLYFPELKTRFRPHQEGNSGSISFLFFRRLQKSAVYPPAHFARPSDIRYRRFHDRCLRIDKPFNLPAARCFHSTAYSRKRTRLKERPSNTHRTNRFCIRCRPFIGHTPRKLPVKHRNLPLHRTSSLVILPHFFPVCNSFYAFKM